MSSNTPQAFKTGLSDREEFGPILSHYVTMARVLAGMFSPVLETVIHDLENPDASIISIHNGHLTGREKGDPATDVVRQLMNGDLPDVIIGYRNESPDGLSLKSSSIAIRNEEDQLIGVMGLNMDISHFDQYGKFITRFIETRESKHVPQSERFRSMVPSGLKSPREDIKNAIEEFRISRNWSTRVLKNGDKRRIVEHLYKEGFFKTKGAVTIIAELLGLTRPSVYTYKNDYIKRVNDEGDS